MNICISFVFFNIRLTKDNASAPDGGPILYNIKRFFAKLLASKFGHDTYPALFFIGFVLYFIYFRTCSFLLVDVIP